MKIPIEVLVNITTFLKNSDVLNMLRLDKKTRRYLLKVFELYFGNRVFKVKSIRGLQKACILLKFKRLHIKDNFSDDLDKIPFIDFGYVRSLNMGKNYWKRRIKFHYLTELEELYIEHARWKSSNHLYSIRKDIKIVYCGYDPYKYISYFQPQIGWGPAPM